MNKEAVREGNSKYPHVFEITTRDNLYFVGEDPTNGGMKEAPVSPVQSGIGKEQAIYWEHAIRQALMPVTQATQTVPPKETSK